MILTPDRVRAALAHHRAEAREHSYIDISRARPAGVILPIIFAGETPRAIFVLRGAHLTDHAGEVGFPGGKPEPGDADLEATAIRELEEEIGLGRADVEVLGRLTPCPVITGRYMIHPFVAAVREGASPTIASPEIARVLALPILPLIRGDMPFYGVAMEWQGVHMVAQHFRIGDAVLYGASSYIFFELLTLIAAELDLPLADPVMETTPVWGNRYRAPRS